MSYRLQAIAAILSLAGGSIAGSPQDAVLAAAADVAKVPAELRPVTRWAYLGHLPAEARREWALLNCGHVNLLSSEADIRRPVVVLAAPGNPIALQDADPLAVKPADWSRAVLLRLQTDWYGDGWKSWDRMVSPHFHANIVAPKFEKQLVTQTVIEEYGYWRRIGTDDQVTREFARANPGITEFHVTRKVPVEKKVEVLVPVRPDGKAVKAAAPYLPTKEWLYLVAETKSEIPVVYADWFLWQTMAQNQRDPGYNDFLGFKDQESYNKLIGFDKETFEKLFAKFKIESRWAVARSPLSQEPRRVARFKKVGGALWLTFDNELAVGDGNPLTTAGDRFTFKASECLGHLPNGLLAAGLFDNKGKIQASAPDFIGKDYTSTDKRGRIENAKSCWACHSDGGLQPLDDYFRHTYQPPVSISDPNYAEIKKIQQQYFQDVGRWLRADRELHASALRDACGLTTEQYSAALIKRWREYADDGVDLARACREIGTTPAVFLPKLRAYCGVPGQSENVLSQWYRPESAALRIGLDQWHEVYGLAAAIAGGYNPAVK